MKSSTVMLSLPDKTKTWEYWAREVNLCRSDLDGWFGSLKMQGGAQFGFCWFLVGCFHSTPRTPLVFTESCWMEDASGMDPCADVMYK